MSTARLLPRACRAYPHPPPIPLDDWPLVPEKGFENVIIPESRQSFTAGAWHRGHAHDPEAIKLGMGEYLLYCGAVGHQLVAAFNRIGCGYFVELVDKRNGRLLRSLRVCPPKGVQWGRDSQERRRAWAVAIAEAATAQLRDGKTCAPRSHEEHTWLRQQLEGLGKERA